MQTSSSQNRYPRDTVLAIVQAYKEASPGTKTSVAREKSLELGYARPSESTLRRWLSGDIPAEGNETTEEKPKATIDDVIKKEQERQEARELARQLTILSRTEAKRQQYISVIRECLLPYEATTVVPSVHLDREREEHQWVLLFSDWHVGQLTSQESTGGLYEQNSVITRRQVEDMFKSIQDIHAVQSAGQNIKELLVVFAGDLLENDSMRASQARGIDKLVTQQAVEVFDLAGWMIKKLLTLPGVENIEVHFVGGNHDRTSAKPGNAGLGELDYIDTYSWFIGELLSRAFSEDPRITVKAWETFFGYTQFGGFKFLFEHGSSFRYGSGSYGGVPYYPIVNSASKLMDMVGGADIVLMGHIHRPGVLPMGQNGWLVINGSLPATTTYVQASFKAIRKPTQWLITMHEDHGAIQFQPLYAPPAGFLPVGSVWNK